MKRKTLFFILLVIVGTLILLPNFYRNSWNAVEPAYYDEWQIRYDRLVIARLARNQQNGFFSDGGLLGLGDAEKWNFLSTTHSHQFDVYLNKGEFQTYLLYKSNPGFQGVFYGTLNTILNVSNKQKLSIFRGLTATLSALSFGFIFAYVITEFGILAGLFTLIFSAISIWLVLPAGSIFWNLWAFFLPFLTATYFLANSTSKGGYPALKIYFLLFSATLVRILMSGFDLITTGLIMTTVPFVFYGVYEKWDRKTFIERFIKIGICLSLATATGLMVMSFQIASTDLEITNVFSYIANRFGSHYAGNSEYYAAGGIEATKIGAVELISKYLLMPAVNVQWPGEDLQILYWQLIIVFILFTMLYFVANRNEDNHSRKAIGLITATWYSLLAPLSWILIFRPHSIIHTHVNTMGWQMPFTLLGVALCGYVITDLFQRREA